MAAGMAQPPAPRACMLFPPVFDPMPINDFAGKRRDAYNDFADKRRDASDEITKNCIMWDPRPGLVLPGRRFRPGSTDVQSSRVTTADSPRRPVWESREGRPPHLARRGPAG